MRTYDELCRKSPFNNLFYDALGDIDLTLGFVPYLLTFLTLFAGADPLRFAALGNLLTFMSYAGDIALLLFPITIVMTFRNDGSSRKTAFYYSFLGILYYATEMGVYIAVHTVLKNTGFNFSRRS